MGKAPPPDYGTGQWLTHRTGTVGGAANLSALLLHAQPHLLICVVAACAGGVAGPHGMFECDSAEADGHCRA